MLSKTVYAILMFCLMSFVLAAPAPGEEEKEDKKGQGIPYEYYVKLIQEGFGPNNFQNMVPSFPGVPFDINNVPYKEAFGPFGPYFENFNKFIQPEAKKEKE